MFPLVPRIHETRDTQGPPMGPTYRLIDRAGPNFHRSRVFDHAFGVHPNTSTAARLITILSRILLLFLA